MLKTLIHLHCFYAHAPALFSKLTHVSISSSYVLPGEELPPKRP